MVASKVEVISRSAKGGLATLWSSDGSGQYTVSDLDPSDAGFDRGTKINIFLREGCEEYARSNK